MRNLSGNFPKTIIAVAALAAAAAIFMSAYFLMKPYAQEGAKTIRVEIVKAGNNSRAVTINTNAEYLRQALEEQRLISGEEGQYGLFITTVDGMAADDSNQEWWCITKSGGVVMTSVDQTPIADGDTYEITLTSGY